VSFRDAFAQAAPQPEWWDRVHTGARIHNFEDLLAYWQASDRSKNQFFKATYTAILEHSDDDDIVVNGISLLPHGDPAYPHTTTMLEFAMRYYSDYERPLEHYGGKRGDAIGGIAEKLAVRYNDDQQYSKSVRLIERVLLEREYQINDHMLELLAREYAEALYYSGHRERAVAVLYAAIEKYDGSWEESLSDQLAQYREQ